MFRAILSLAVLSTLTAAAENITFPADAGIVDLKRDYGAKGDGISDDTAAIQKALNEHKGVLYFANGTYLVSAPLRWKLSGTGTTSRQIFQGQSTAGTVLRLKDNTPGYQDPTHPAEILWTGKSPAQSFRNGLRNLTIDSGSGNAGAAAVRFFANNQGGISDVHIRSGDGRGVIGLDLGYTGEQGPLLLRNVRVTGFDVGIDTKGGNSVTAEFVTLEKQNRVGWSTRNQTLSVRGLTSSNEVTALENLGGALVTLLDARLDGIAAAQGLPAIVNDGTMFARNILASGYAKAIGGKRGTDGTAITEWTSHPPVSLFPSPPRALNLPVKETPDVPWDAPQAWVSMTKFPPKETMMADENGKERSLPDYTASLQQAIDSGATTVYMPTGNYTFSGTVHLRGNVRRLIGMESTFGKKTGRCELVVDDGTAPVVRIERFDWIYSNVFVRHRANRTLVLCSIAGGQSYDAETGHGDLFIEDVTATQWIFHGGNVWARQLNPEGGYGTLPTAARGTYTPGYDMILNDGATLWIWGLKTEGDGTPITAIHGARTEICGYIYANKNYRPEKQWLVNVDSSFSLSVCEAVIRNAPFDPVFETRHGETRIYRKNPKGGGSTVVLFTGYEAPAIKGAAPR